MLFCLLECDPPSAGAVSAHLAQGEQGRACDWNHMRRRQVMGVISHTAAAELVIQTARGSQAALGCVRCLRKSHLSWCIQWRPTADRACLRYLAQNRDL